MCRHDRQRVGLRERKKARTREALQGRRDGALHPPGLRRHHRRGDRRRLRGLAPHVLPLLPHQGRRAVRRHRGPAGTAAGGARRPARRRPRRSWRSTRRCGRSRSTTATTAPRSLPGRRSSQGSPQLQAYKAEHQHGWEAAVVDALERRPRPAGARGRRARSYSCSPRSPPRRCGCRSTQWIADAAGPDLDVRARSTRSRVSRRGSTRPHSG